MANTDPEYDTQSGASTQIIQVVALALYNPRKKRYLIVRRDAQQSGAGFWEFPGGKIESGESHKQALIREIFEELRYKLDENQLTYVHTNRHKYPKRTVDLHLYKFESTEEKMILVDHDALAWVSQSEIGEYNLALADIPFVKYLFQ